MAATPPWGGVARHGSNTITLVGRVTTVNIITGLVATGRRVTWSRTMSLDALPRDITPYFHILLSITLGYLEAKCLCKRSEFFAMAFKFEIYLLRHWSISKHIWENWYIRADRWILLLGSLISIWYLTHIRTNCHSTKFCRFLYEIPQIQESARQIPKTWMYRSLASKNSNFGSKFILVLVYYSHHPQIQELIHTKICQKEVNYRSVILHTVLTWCKTIFNWRRPSMENNI